MIAKNVEECWQIAFDEAEDCQREMNRLRDSSHIMFREKYEELKNKRDMASLIARLIKYGESARHMESFK